MEVNVCVRERSSIYKLIVYFLDLLKYIYIKNDLTLGFRLTWKII